MPSTSKQQALGMFVRGIFAATNTIVQFPGETDDMDTPWAELSASIQQRWMNIGHVLSMGMKAAEETTIVPSIPV